MFVVSLISRIGPVSRPAHRLFMLNLSLGQAQRCLATPGNACIRRFGVNAIRAARRMAGYASGPLTPTVCLLIALTVAAIVIAGALSTTSVGDELGRAVRLSWWFA
ncbi:hypothetical protein SBC1_70320 (plasmid) [Caballeronia sp. SBC1]|uniref:hypothetical protein n=1 Tax=unclassified Caballeronia TaxID=2646786 RepID=UPI0013E18716|nr:MULTISPECIES: hypothetical protein [unclassified Caballeronia]QIE28930.1 hypothetical protein SBC2_70060 [Caballeronia sp. SBC2]QIN66985.1 hypothetical protein SBC1_70320 [Caballeronia sp. SBC1]